MEQLRPQHSGRNGRLGTSYLELTAALFVFSVGLMGAFHVFNFTLSKMRVLKEDSIAMRAIQNELETLCTQPFSGLVDGVSPLSSACPELNQLKDVRTEVQVAPYDVFPDDLKRVEISVQWIGDNGRSRELSSTTLIGNRGLHP